MAMVQFCGDDNDLDDAELWAVIDSVAAHSAQKKQSRKPSSSPQNQKTNSGRLEAALTVREVPNSPALRPPQHLSEVTPDQKRAQKSHRRFPEHNALPLPYPSPQQPGYRVDEESNGGEVIQRPWLHRPPHALTIYDSSNNEARRHHHNNNDNYSHNRNYNYNYASAAVKAKPLQQIAVGSPPPKRQHLVQDLACRPGGSMDEKENNPAIIPASLDGHNSFWNVGVPSATLFKQYQNTAMSILEKGDYVVLQGKPFIKKTGWRKIAFFFNISFEIKDRTIQLDERSNVIRAEFVVRASMQGGRFSDGWASCDRGEKRFSKPNHDIPGTAETRAKTRACQDLLGIGEYKPGDSKFG